MLVLVLFFFFSCSSECLCLSQCLCINLWLLLAASISLVVPVACLVVIVVVTVVVVVLMVVVVVVLVASLLFVPSLTKSDSSQSSAHRPTRLHHWRLIIDQFPSTFLRLPAANHLPPTTINANQSCFHFIEIIGKL